jgi:hypothetical protein
LALSYFYAKQRRFAMSTTFSVDPEMVDFGSGKAAAIMKPTT